MPTATQIRDQINRLIAHLVEIGLVNDQNFAYVREFGGTHLEVSFQGAEHLSLTLKNREYAQVYRELQVERAFTMLMADSAIIQMNYIFNGSELERHRLAFLPSPFLERFQNDPDIYLEEVLYAEVVAKNIVPFPLRFDFDAREGVYTELHHPKSHLTLGQYENCRIPVTAPLTPSHFVDFILRHFYNTAFLTYVDRLPRFNKYFEDTYLPAERSVLHVNVPALLTTPGLP